MKNTRYQNTNLASAVLLLNFVLQDLTDEGLSRSIIMAQDQIDRADATSTPDTAVQPLLNRIEELEKELAEMTERCMDSETYLANLRTNSVQQISHLTAKLDLLRSMMEG